MTGMGYGSVFGFMLIRTCYGACMPISSECMKGVECAFGSAAEFERTFAAVEAATANCTGAPKECTPTLKRYLRSGTHAVCGENEGTRHRIAQVCDLPVSGRGFACDVTEKVDASTVVLTLGASGLYTWLAMNALRSDSGGRGKFEFSIGEDSV